MRLICNPGHLKEDLMALDHAPSYSPHAPTTVKAISRRDSQLLMSVSTYNVYKDTQEKCLPRNKDKS